ncbi:hypothetical protein O6H91_20G054000 [Diphasiastrum complanatum]|uniref:Uncharacterized protein n=1 Tax=Diphasiastrum complanatum TaxID=34168 RepID=A0ACC2AQH2_DIPCM|nr:hypothetical protein O6H91_20G054000 [Diphasiastrum complanatum]
MAACFGPLTESVIMRIPRLLLICVVLLLSAILFSWQFISPTNWTFASGFHPNHLPCLINKVLSKRGANLLHGWTDDELFERSIVVSTFFSRNLSAGEINGSSFDEILALDNVSGANSRDSALVQNVQGYIDCLERTVSGEGKPKIAFLFLTRDSKLPFAPLWNLFFKGKENLYSIYVHSDPSLFNLQNRNIGIFWGRFISSGQTQHGTASLIQAARRLLANALLDDPLNEYFALLSEHCIPLHSFKYIYDKITASSQSFQDIGDWPYLLGRYDARGKDVMLPEVPFSEFRMGSQFFVLIKKHALMFVEDQKYWNKFKLPCLPEGPCYPEEHYFPTLLHIEDPKGFTGYSLTYMNWDEAQGPHPKSYKKEEINQALIVYLRSKNNGRFVFARKFDDDCLPKLLNLTGIIFQE